MTIEEINREIGELREFVIATTAEMREIDVQLEPI